MRVEPFPKPEFSALPREGCRGVVARVLLTGPVAVAELRFEEQGMLDLHTADHPIEVLCVEGSGQVQVGDEVAGIAAGERVHWPAHVPHRLWTEGVSMRTLMIERLG